MTIKEGEVLELHFSVLYKDTHPAISVNDPEFKEHFRKIENEE